MLPNKMQMKRLTYIQRLCLRPGLSWALVLSLFLTMPSSVLAYPVHPAVVSQGVWGEVQSPAMPWAWNPDRVYPSFTDSTRSVTMIFSSHGSAVDGQWAAGKLIRLGESVPRSKPVVIWIEHAEPAGLPANLEELQQRIPVVHGQPVDWCRELVLYENSGKIEMLRVLFEQALSAERDPKILFQHATDAYSTQLRKGIEDLRRRGRPVDIRVEEPSAEAYLNMLRRDAMGLMAAYWLRQGKFPEAWASLMLAYRYFDEGLRLRDHLLGERIRRSVLTGVPSQHMIVRGSAHQKNLMDYWDHHEQKYSCVTQPLESGSGESSRPDLTAYVAEYFSIPQPDTETGRNFIGAQISGLARQFSLR